MYENNHNTMRAYLNGTISVYVAKSGDVESMKIALVSCTKLKADYPCSAKEMYQKSTFFKKAIQYIEQQNYHDWFVISAKYGILRKHEEIEPYDLTLNNMTVIERKKWSDMLLKQIISLQINISQIDFYAGKKYREYLIPAIEEKGIICKVPLQGKGIGEQLQYYSLNTK